MVEGGICVLAAECPNKCNEVKLVSARKLRVISLTLVCVAGVGVAGLLLSRQAGPQVQLVFVGYTNILLEIRGKGGSDRDTVWMTKAVIAVTNCGSASVKIASIAEAYPSSQISYRIAQSSYLLTPASVIKAGKSEVCTMYVPATESPWRANVAYRRQGWTESAMDRARNSPSRVVRAAVQRLLPAPKLRWVQSDWITNSPAPSSRYHITAPPPDIRIELLPLRPRQ